jgi:magnesium transporter
MFDLTKEYIEELKDVFKLGDEARALKMIEPMHASDVADLFDSLSLEEAKFFYLLLDSELASDVLIELDEDERKKLLKELPGDVIARQFIDGMESDDAADIIGEMEEERQEEILSHIGDVDQAGDIVDLLHYEEDTAGGMMGKELIAVNSNWSMPTCIEEVRKQSKNIKEIYYVYVVNDDNVLEGVLPLKKLITSPSVSKVKHIMVKDLVTVQPDMDNEEVAQVIEKYDLIAIPVVDSIGRLVGRITVDDVVDVIREEAEKDYQLASGITVDVESSDSVGKLTRARLPWLLIGLAGGVFAAQVLGLFEGNLGKYPILAAFIPLIAAMGGNVGIQSSAIVVQSIASNSNMGSSMQKIMKEISVALVNATILAGVVFVGYWFFGNNVALTYTVSISLFAIVIFAAIFGTTIPLMLHRMKIDPAVATGPFITTFNDIIGLYIYMYISTLFF